MTGPIRSFALRLLPALALWGLAAAPAAAQTLQLRDGRVLVGEVVDANSEGLSFRRLDNGGLLELSWDDLSVLFAERIRRQEGLVVEDDSLVTVQADVIKFLVGGITEEVSGVITEWTDTHVLLKRKSGVLPIVRNTIRDVRQREVAALEIYTTAEWYALKLAEIAPGDDPDAHVRLAEEMRRVGMYEKTIEHLEKAQELGGGRSAAQIPSMLQRAHVLAESAEERDMLSQIRALRNREEFEKATALIAEFEQRFPTSKLARELDREKQRLAAAREVFLVERMRQLWDRTVRTLADQAAKDRELSVVAARTYAEDQMVRDVFQRMAEVLEVEPREAEELWAKRLEHGHIRTTLYSYGIGSWLLGADAVVKGTKRESGPGAGGRTGSGDSAQDRELERLVRRMRELAQRGRQAAAQRRGDQGEETEEDWWRDASRDDRTSWLRAYFAEFSGRMEVMRAYATECATCNGEGNLVEIATSGQEQKRTCPLCHGTRFTRAIRVR